MRKVMIVGAGQAGLHLALGLQREGYEVTVTSAKTPGEIEHGRVMSSQFQFKSTLDLERSLGIYFWEGARPHVAHTTFALGTGGPTPELYWEAPLRFPGADIDQRVKMSTWLRTFAERGGDVVIGSATLADLDRWSAEYDLVVVAAGKGELSGAFTRDESRSAYTQPQRRLSLVYVNGYGPDPSEDRTHAVDFHFLPGVGEFIVMPTLTTSGPCHVLFFEAVPGGPLDAFGSLISPQEHLERFVDLMRRFVPWTQDRFDNLELTDAGATLSGAVTPVVRKPALALPSGGYALGLGDALITNDPITGQGTNLAAKAAHSYMESILARGGESFTKDFMDDTFERFWRDHGRATTEWSNMMLGPPQPHAMELLGAAAAIPAIGDRYIGGFEDPNEFDEWFLDPDKARAYLTEAGQEAYLAAQNGGAA